MNSQLTNLAKEHLQKPLCVCVCVFSNSLRTHTHTRLLQRCHSVLSRSSSLPGPPSVLSEYSFRFLVQLSSIFFTLVVSAAVTTPGVSAPPSPSPPSPLQKGVALVRRSGGRRRLMGNARARFVSPVSPFRHALVNLHRQAPPSRKQRSAAVARGNASQKVALNIAFNIQVRELRTG